MVEYERLRRLRKKEQGLKSVYNLKRDGKTGIADQSRTGACRNVAKKHEMAETGSRYRRDSDWFFESLKGLLTDDEGDPLALVVNTQSFKGAHYSSFPEKVVEPLIRAGTSERGCCPKCGGPWKRVIEKGLIAHDGNTASKYQKGSMANRLSRLRQAARERGEEYQNQTKTIGWQSTCSCDAGDPVPCVVMDPFGGTNTVGKVAEILGRKWISIDLGYQDLAAERVKNVQKQLF